MRLLILIFVFNAVEFYSQVFPVNEIINNGQRDKRINIVFLGDGYTSDQMNDFNNDVDGVINELFAAEPYLSYKNYFNVYSIEVQSDESGSKHPGTADDEPSGLQTFSKNTFFNSTYDFGGIHRLLVIQNYSAVNSVLSANFPDWDIVFFIVNHEYYGGSGGSYAVTSINSQSFEVAIHEVGHSFAGLADEYEYGNSNGFEAPNATAETLFDNIKWNKWIEASTPLPTPENDNYKNEVGLFEGAVYNSTGWYRPKLECKMKILNRPFCEVCAEQTVISIYNYLNTIDEHYPENGNLIIASEDKREFRIETIDPDSRNIFIQWLIDGNPVSDGNKSFTLDASLLNPGSHELKVIATDNSDFVRNDPLNLLSSEFIWNINIENTTSIDEENIGVNFSLMQNFPNPFNPTTKIKYSLAEAGETSLKIFDMFGREVNVLVNEFKSAGKYYLDFNAAHLSSGVYFYVLTSGKHKEVKKLMLVK